MVKEGGVTRLYPSSPSTTGYGPTLTPLRHDHDHSPLSFALSHLKLSFAPFKPSEKLSCDPHIPSFIFELPHRRLERPEHQMTVLIANAFRSRRSHRFREKYTYKSLSASPMISNTYTWKSKPSIRIFIFINSICCDKIFSFWKTFLKKRNQAYTQHLKIRREVSNASRRH